MLSDGLNTLFGKDTNAFIIHELPDRYVSESPTKDASGGTRVACGVIIKGANDENAECGKRKSRHEEAFSRWFHRDTRLTFLEGCCLLRQRGSPICGISLRTIA
ncbi:MAG: hypothetical protein EHM80_14940 [Nitrospiraceae bacterium]|nr:MAG: hypothetical protein EHM80_14940 [Nitrospiraceae bacterium]